MEVGRSDYRLAVMCITTLLDPLWLSDRSDGTNDGVCSLEVQSQDVQGSGGILRHSEVAETWFQKVVLVAAKRISKSLAIVGPPGVFSLPSSARLIPGDCSVGLPE